mmetsp:Transcript_24183/g.36722  ORF Transcript_24183/g.36722 Transcript_24183/m.36722 type:complete len:202 (-) Transcript_24183:158-763(-)
MHIPLHCLVGSFWVYGIQQKIGGIVHSFVFRVYLVIVVVAAHLIRQEALDPRIIWHVLILRHHIFPVGTLLILWQSLSFWCDKRTAFWRNRLVLWHNIASSPTPVNFGLVLGHNILSLLRIHILVSVICAVSIAWSVLHVAGHLPRPTSQVFGLFRFLCHFVQLPLCFGQLVFEFSDKCRIILHFVYFWRNVNKLSPSSKF